MRGGIFLGGEYPQITAVKPYIDKLDIIIAADSGLQTAEAWGYRPSYILGDMDSLDSWQRLAKYPLAIISRFPPKKDETDAELAVRYLQANCDDITLIGGGGGRIDHSLLILKLFEREQPPRRWFCAHESLFCLEAASKYSKLKIDTLPGTVLSVFPIANGPWAIDSIGIEWPLKPLNWTKNTYSMSNESKNGPIELTAQSGRFLIILGYSP